MIQLFDITLYNCFNTLKQCTHVIEYILNNTWSIECNKKDRHLWSHLTMVVTHSFPLLMGSRYKNILRMTHGSSQNKICQVLVIINIKSVDGNLYSLNPEFL